MSVSKVICQFQICSMCYIIHYILGYFMGHASFNWVPIGTCHGMAPPRCQTITWTIDDILSIGTLGSNFSWNFVKKNASQIFVSEMRPFCHGIGVLQPIQNTANLIPIFPLTFGSYTVSTGRGEVFVITPSIPCEAPEAIATALCTRMSWLIMILHPVILIIYLVWYHRKPPATS